jgi:hypothetical protein
MPVRYIPALIIIISLLIGSIYFFKADLEYIADMKYTEGEVIKLGSKSVSSSSSGGSVTSSNSQPIVQFSVGGEVYFAEGRAMGIPKWKKGDLTGVFYDPNDPGRNRIDRIDEKFIYPLIMLFFLSGGLLFALVNFIYYKKTGRVLS